NFVRKALLTHTDEVLLTYRYNPLTESFSFQYQSFTVNIRKIEQGKACQNKLIDKKAKNIFYFANCSFQELNTTIYEDIAEILRLKRPESVDFFVFNQKEPSNGSDGLALTKSALPELVAKYPKRSIDLIDLSAARCPLEKTVLLFLEKITRKITQKPFISEKLA
ncbi:MAG: hypothetical protein ACFFD4_28605, partial [Candidatus Odinarchaeota archaeon]